MRREDKFVMTVLLLVIVGVLLLAAVGCEKRTTKNFTTAPTIVRAWAERLITDRSGDWRVWSLVALDGRPLRLAVGAEPRIGDTIRVRLPERFARG